MGAELGNVAVGFAVAVFVGRLVGDALTILVDVDIGVKVSVEEGVTVRVGV